MKYIFKIVISISLFLPISCLSDCSPNAVNTQYSSTTPLRSISDNSCIVNLGSIVTTGEESSAIVSSGNGAYSYNNSTVTTHGNASNGIYSAGLEANNINNGSIVTQGDYSHGIFSSGANSVAFNGSAGLIYTSGNYSHGIYSNATNTTTSLFENYGSISTIGSSSNGIYITGQNTYLSNFGSILTYGENAHGVYSIGVNNLVSNFKFIITNAISSHGIFTEGQNTAVNNYGSILTYGENAYGVYSTGGNSLVSNHGLIRTNAIFTHGIFTVGQNTLVQNYSSILTNGSYANAIYSQGTMSSIKNYGQITSNQYGIISEGMNAYNSNFNRITITGLGGIGMYATGELSNNSNFGAIETNLPFSVGIQVDGSNSIILNNGQINTLADHSYGVVSFGNSSLISNTGYISTGGSWALAINSAGSSATIINSGVITTLGNNGYGIGIFGNNSVCTNTGIIRALGQDSAAILIYFAASNSTVNINPGSIITGDISAHLDVIGAKLNINLGSGVSYAYSVTGPWTVSDLDNRPMVTGSAYAAGIGAQETASEMLYQRTSSITSALDRRNRSYNANYLENQPYWLDVYYADVTRHSGGNYSTQTAFANYNYGMTAGFKLAEQYTPLELVVSVEQSKLNIDSGNQKVDSTSLMAGLSVPNLAEVLGARLSAKAMVGYADHDGDRKVMTNSVLYDGSRQIKSDYKSHTVLLGAALNKPFELSDHLVADVLIGVDYTAQRVRAYSEEDYFAWDKRTLSQVQSRVQLGLEGFFFNNRGSVFGQLGAEHRDLIGGATQGYSINGTSVSFNTNNKNDTYLTAQMGMKVQLDKRIHLFGLVNKLHSSDNVDSLSGNIGLRADF